MLLAHDLAAELVRVALGLRLDLLAPGLVMGEAAIDPPGRAVFEPDDAAGQRLEQSAIVADQHQPGAQRSQLGLQPFDRRQVQVIGRLVEQQQVRLGRKRAGQGGAALLAAGERRRVLRRR